MKLLRCILVVFLLALAIGLPGSAPPVLAQTTPTQGPTDAKEVEAFFDGLIGSQFQANHIAGAEVAVVKDGQVLFIKGYGEADLEKHLPVDPNQTLMRPASVAKLFTWTAVMQLVEQGKLDLTADVNTYLTDLQIPATFPQPITLLDLMNHTPGFEDNAINTMTQDASKIVPLGKYLAENMPTRVRPPGQISAYSNYGATLAGYIVEQVSGIPFDQYIQAYIFQPLGMEHSTFAQPLPAALAPDMSEGYTFENGSFTPNKFEIILQAPAGGLSSTAGDIARFMIAHLQLGRYGDARILQEATARQMHQQSFTHDSQVSGFAHGFMEMELNGQHAIWHGGNTIYFHSALVLIPAQNVGFFVSYNSQDGERVTGNTLNAVFNHYYPVSSTPAALPVTGSAQSLAQYTGSYLASRSNYTTILKIVGLFEPVTVTALSGSAPEGRSDSGGQLQISGLGSGRSRWVEVSPGVFQSPDPNLAGEKFVFRKGAQGQVQYLFSNQNPSNVLIKQPWYGAPSFHYGLLAACVILFLSMFVAVPVGLLVARKQGQGRWPLTSRWASVVVWIYCALTLFFVIAFFMIYSDPNIVFGYPPELTYLLVIPVLTAVLAAGLVVFTILAWKNRYWRLAGRIHYTLVTLAALAFAWFLNYWNFLPPKM